MKKSLIAVVTLFFLTSFVIASVQDVVTAVRNGNASQISKFFDNTVEITLANKSYSYSKSQAELVLKDFFNTNIVRSFDVIHTGDNLGSQYCIGTLQTKNGIYRTTIYCKKKGDKQVLQEIRFEK